MADKAKYSLGEAILLLFVGGAFVPLVVIGMLPFDLFLAWMRVTVWRWFFVPYFHAPQISVWMMLVIMLFWAMFRKSSRDMKADHYKNSFWTDWAWSVAGETMIFGLLYCIHLWILKG